MSAYRSTDWFGKKDKMGFIYRSWMKNQGMPEDMFDGRPVIGICNTWSELTPCNAHLRDIAESVRRGVLEAGGFQGGGIIRRLTYTSIDVIEACASTRAREPTLETP